MEGKGRRPGPKAPPVTREWPADWPPARRHHKPPAWLYFVIVAMVAVIAGMPELGPLFHRLPAYLALFALFLLLASLFPKRSHRHVRYLDKIDRALGEGMADLERGRRAFWVLSKLEWRTGGGRRLSKRPRRWYNMAIEYLETGHPAVAGRFLWLARLERLREVRA